MKKYLKYILLIIIIVIIIVLSIMYYPTKVAILGYHDFTDGLSTNDLQMNINKFDNEMQYLSNHHYQSLTLDDLNCYLNKTCKISKKSVMITMDDGWINELKLAAPILKKYNLNAVIFYVGSNYDHHNSNFMSLSDLNTLKEDYPNIEVASHTYDMHYDNAYLNDYSTLNNDFNKMESIVSTKYFAYPYGFYNDTYIQVLKDNNYNLAFTFGPGKKHRKCTQNDSKYEVPRLNISNSMSFNKFKLRLLMPY
jgi:peptidoglycan/xylan/chitin deacetylase (PgdA/CDA1 family)